MLPRAPYANSKPFRIPETPEPCSSQKRADITEIFANCQKWRHCTSNSRKFATTLELEFGKFSEIFFSRSNHSRAQSPTTQRRTGTERGPTGAYAERQAQVACFHCHWPCLGGSATSATIIKATPWVAVVIYHASATKVHHSEQNGVIRPRRRAPVYWTAASSAASLLQPPRKESFSFIPDYFRPLRTRHNTIKHERTGTYYVNYEKLVTSPTRRRK